MRNFLILIIALFAISMTVFANERKSASADVTHSVVLTTSVTLPSHKQIVRTQAVTRLERERRIRFAYKNTLKFITPINQPFSAPPEFTKLE